MNHCEIQFPSGTKLNMRNPDSSFAIQGEVVADFGVYLIVKPQKKHEADVGQKLKVSIVTEKGTPEFDSYICFLDDRGAAEESYFCIYLPPDLGKAERRKYLRVSLELTMTYRVADKILQGKTINVSAGGAYFFTPERLEIGQELELDLLMPAEVLRLHARVVRTMFNAASVEFLGTTPQIDTLAAYIYRFSRIG